MNSVYDLKYILDFARNAGVENFDARVRTVLTSEYLSLHKKDDTDVTRHGIFEGEAFGLPCTAVCDTPEIDDTKILFLFHKELMMIDLRVLTSMHSFCRRDSKRKRHGYWLILNIEEKELVFISHDENYPIIQVEAIIIRACLERV